MTLISKPCTQKLEQPWTTLSNLYPLYGYRMLKVDASRPSTLATLAASSAVIPWIYWYALEHSRPYLEKKQGRFSSLLVCICLSHLIWFECPEFPWNFLGGTSTQPWMFVYVPQENICYFLTNTNTSCIWITAKWWNARRTCGVLTCVDMCYSLDMSQAKIHKGFCL